MNIHILAIDPSLTRTGHCADGICADIAPDPRQPVLERIGQIEEHIRGLAWALNPDLIVIEENITGRGASTGSIATSWLHGILRYTLHRLSPATPVLDIAQARRAKYACGNQKDRGKDAVLLAAERAGAKAENNDQADAWWLWRIASDAYTRDPADAALPVFRREVLAAIHWPELYGHRPAWNAPRPTKRSRAAA